MYYTVQPGDTLWSIANRFGTTYQSIMEANNLTSPNLQVGQRLFIPTPTPHMPTPIYPHFPPHPPMPPYPMPDGMPGRHLMERVDRLERRVAQLDQRLDRLERRVDRLEQHLPAPRSES
ncbi:LysM domain protein [[Clostridium] ultunense Esp]|uniref:LysM peptidoglycan-binding domain-containing protein n=1 Tax=Thermicanus aegyptius TaxID=94009 RepID=UPI0002B6FBB7|nr:LysM peptidoglycan-binding domain-containing protein [Thermicanus aegyptius]CCQ93343.1 LysM domain protein [[Clostridium] ultunense Esp]